MSRIHSILRRWLRNSSHDVLHAPLLDGDEVARLLAQSRNLDLLAGAPASEFVAGDIATRRAGSGMEFDDNRPYQSGDDARYINWRLTARAGSPYVKIFREERRPCAFVVLDRRAAMRFATVGRLKVHHGAAAAILFAAAAAHHGAPVGGLVLDPHPRWLEPRHGESGLRLLADAAAAPAPPLDGVSEPALADVLNQLAARLRPSDDVLLISDFADLTETCVPTLVRLVSEHRVRVLQISDPAEFALPDAGLVEVAGAAGGAAMAIDSHRDELRRAFESLAQDRAHAQAQWFAAAGIGLHRLSTAETLLPHDLVAA